MSTRRNKKRRKSEKTSRKNLSGGVRRRRRARSQAWIEKAAIARAADIELQNICNVYVEEVDVENNTLIEDFKRLLDNGANPNIFVNEDIILTPLTWCISFNLPRPMEYLLSRGADPNQVDSEGQDSLQKAISYGSTECVSILLNYNVDINRSINGKSTPLLLAIQENNLACVKMLIAREVDPYIRATRWADIGMSPSGDFPLDAAEWYISDHVDAEPGNPDRIEIVKVLKTYIDNLNKRTARRSMYKTLRSIKDIDSNAALMKVLQNDDLAREIRAYL